MDTSPALSGKDVKPQFVENYDGGDICLNKEKDICTHTDSTDIDAETCRKN